MKIRNITDKEFCKMMSWNLIQMWNTWSFLVSSSVLSEQFTFAIYVSRNNINNEKKLRHTYSHLRFLSSDHVENIILLLNFIYKYRRRWHLLKTNKWRLAIFLHGPLCCIFAFLSRHLFFFHYPRYSLTTILLWFFTYSMVL